MSYYILPKIINIVNVSPESSSDEIKPYISFSLLNYYTNINTQIIDMFNNAQDISNNTYNESLKIVNPYEFIYSKVPGSKFSVSKLKPRTNLFYDLIEICNNLNIFEPFKYKDISSLIISPNHHDIIDCHDIFRENFSDNKISFDDINIDNNYNEQKFDFIFYETNTDNYFVSIIKLLMIAFKNQTINGNLIIKIDNLFYKPVIDMLYILSCLYEKVYITKPNTNNITSFDKYIVCKNFLFGEKSEDYLKLNYFRLIIFIKKLEGKFIKQILNFDIPYYFKIKINDLNIIIGQQQLESLDQIISIYKNKNKDDKIESIKKSNIQKSVSWCEKYKIPCNKFTEKINIFLPIINNETI
jgi:hypothetical protein